MEPGLNATLQKERRAAATRASSVDERRPGEARDGLGSSARREERERAAGAGVARLEEAWSRGGRGEISRVDVCVCV